LQKKTLNTTKENTWFASWFDSKYYHILYNNRNENEAADFLNNIIQQFEIKDQSRILDLACGKGRHAKFLASKKLGTLDVVGVDLSENSIKSAKQFEQSNLKFEVADMRNFSFEKPFDYIFNLFTSFGYFDALQDNIAVLNAVNKNLKTGGILLIDFLNAIKVQLNLMHREELVKEGIHFFIERKVEHGKVVKRITFEASGTQHNYEEKVQLLSIDGFRKMLEATGFEILDIYGNYTLQKYNDEKSDRLIIKARKK